MAVTLRRFPAQKFRVSVHTDGQGSAESNLDLSRRRAAAVAAWFVAAGIGADRFETRAFGETRPIASNETVSGRLENRRVELDVVR